MRKLYDSETFEEIANIGYATDVKPKEKHTMYE